MIELALGFAIIVQDQTSLRAAPRDSAPAHTLLWQGEALEVRGERLDYLQVYDHRRERAGFVRSAQARRFKLTPQEAPELLALLRFLDGTPGAEALGIGLAAAYLQAAPAASVQGEAGAAALDALGGFAERLARRASPRGLQTRETQAVTSAHLDVAARYGVHFTTHEFEGRLILCYEGEAFRRVLVLPATAEQRSRAALALTRLECNAAELHPQKQRRLDEWRAEALDRVDADALPPMARNRILMRRAAVWARLAFQRARQGEAAQAAAQRALESLAGVRADDLTENDRRTYAEAAMRVNASRWAMAAVPAAADVKSLRVETRAEETGETCVVLLDAKSDAKRPLARRCTFALVWPASATVNSEGTALALAVQSTETWRELWVFRKGSAGWTVRVLPPASSFPEVGYAEFAGWVPGGKQILAVREAAVAGKHSRRFELLRLDTLATIRQAAEPAALSAFQQWQDASWKQHTLSLR
jgi:hypothetical protein